MRTPGLFSVCEHWLGDKAPRGSVRLFEPVKPDASEDTRELHAAALEVWRAWSRVGHIAQNRPEAPEAYGQTQTVQDTAALLACAYRALQSLLYADLAALEQSHQIQALTGATDEPVEAPACRL